MNDGPRYVTFRDYLRVVRERRVLVVLIAVAFAGAALGWSIRQDPTYQGEASLEFRDENVDTSGVGVGTATGGQTAEQRAAISAQTVNSRDVAERAKEILDTSQPAEQLQGQVSGRPESRTNLVVIIAKAGTPEGAADLANAFAQAASDEARATARRRYEEAADAQREVAEALGGSRATRFQRVLLRQQIAKLEQAARIVEPAVLREEARPPSTPVAPKPVRNTALGLLLGLTLGLVAAFLRDSLDRRFRNSREITDELHLPLLGYVREDLLGRSVTSSDGKALAAQELEGFRILRTNLDFLDVDNQPKVVLVTSALPEEGKSTVSAALAAAYASAGRRTLLVECDLRRPTQARRLGISEKPGLTDYLVGRATPPEVIQTVALPTIMGNGAGPVAEPQQIPLVCITAGSQSPQPAELLRSERAQSFVKQVSEVYDAVVIDTSPLLSVVDALELVPLADAVIMCVRASQTTREQARAARRALEHLPTKPTGVVVTGIRAREEAADYGYYSYGYVYGDER